MIKNDKSGTNTKAGLIFDGKTDFATFLSIQSGYSVDGDKVFYNGEFVARVLKQRQILKFLKELGVDHTKVISKPLSSNNCIHVIVNNTVFIIESMIHRSSADLIETRLQGCNFKKKQYKKLFAPLNIEVEYMYLLSDWFRNPKYKDVLDYISTVNCHYCFENIPLAKLGLPEPPKRAYDTDVI